MLLSHVWPPFLLPWPFYMVPMSKHQGGWEESEWHQSTFHNHSETLSAVGGHLHGMYISSHSETVPRDSSTEHSSTLLLLSSLVPKQLASQPLPWISVPCLDWSFPLAEPYWKPQAKGTWLILSAGISFLEPKGAHGGERIWRGQRRLSSPPDKLVCASRSLFCSIIRWACPRTNAPC